jgi:cytoskeletal protein RodZ
MKEPKKTSFKINAKKRNIIIASGVAVVVVIAGIVTGVVISHNNSVKTEIAEATTDATVADENETNEVEDVEETEVATEKTKAEKTTEATTTNDTTLTGNKKTASNTETVENTKPATNDTKPATNDTKPVHTHSYTSSVTTQPTCGQNGVRTYKCSCGDTYTESVAATGNHNYVQASCTSDTCSTCGATRSADHHNYEAHYATRTVETIVECDQCNCGAWLRTTDEYHSHMRSCGGFTNGAYYEETEEQYIDYYKCSICGATK